MMMRMRMMALCVLASLAVAARGVTASSTRVQRQERQLVQISLEGPTRPTTQTLGACEAALAAKPSFTVTGMFSGGNVIIIDGRDLSSLVVAIVPDPYSYYDNQIFLQAWAFRVQGVRGKKVNVTVANTGLANASSGAANGGLDKYKARYSYDRKKWVVTQDTVYNATGKAELTFTVDATKPTIYFAYAPIYGFQDYMDWAASLSNVKTSVPWGLIQIGLSPEARPVDLLTIGTPAPSKLKVWFTARAHPGETYSSWYTEGLVSRLLNASDPVAQKLLKEAVFYIVPMINPDSCEKGFYRTSAVGNNFNRVWDVASPNNAPELFWTQQQMRRLGVDFYLDVHNIEARECAFVFWPAYGVKDSWNSQLQAITDKFDASYIKANRDFDNTCVFGPDPKDSTPPVYGDAWVTSVFKTPGGTLEMPMIDVAKNPNKLTQFSPERATKLGASVLEPLLAIAPQLRAYRKLG